MRASGFSLDAILLSSPEHRDLFPVCRVAGTTEVHILKLYAVKVRHVTRPGNYETIWVRTSTARRAQDLAIESYPGCNARVLGVFVEGTWHCAAHDE
jgi:hypothetical protein